MYGVPEQKNFTLVDAVLLLPEATILLQTTVTKRRSLTEKNLKSVMDSQPVTASKCCVLLYVVPRGGAWGNTTVEDFRLDPAAVVVLRKFSGLPPLVKAPKRARAALKRSRAPAAPTADQPAAAGPQKSNASVSVSTDSAVDSQPAEEAVVGDNVKGAPPVVSSASAAPALANALAPRPAVGRTPKKPWPTVTAMYVGVLGVPLDYESTLSEIAEKSKNELLGSDGSQT